MKNFLKLLTIVLPLIAQSVAADTCGATEQPCEVADGQYYIALPEGEGPAPVVLWLHGFGGSGAATVRNENFVKGFTTRGYAVVLPDGQVYNANSDALDWGVSDGSAIKRDDIGFLQDVMGDAIDRFSLDGERVLATGFSRGGSMVWDLACQAPQIADGFAAISGAFWEPFPTNCKEPVHLRHTHGFTDRVVPLEGRAVNFGGQDFVQGNVFTGFEILRGVNGCRLAADDNRVDGDLWHKAWRDCTNGSLTLELVPGGHGIPKGWKKRTLVWFKEINLTD